MQQAGGLALESHRLRLVGSPLLRQMLCAHPLFAANERVEVNLFEQVALGMAAADLQHAGKGAAEFPCRRGMVALGMGQQPQRGR